MADTSLFIHHPDKIEDWDLASLLHIREEPIYLLVPMVVVDELDGLKESKNSHVRWRARHSLTELDRLLPNPTQAAELRPEDYTPLNTGGIPRGQVSVEVVVDSRGHVRLPINDDEIVDQVVLIQALAGRPITLITFDTGQSMRARAAGIQTRKIPQPHED
ncbi:PIN domain-containing protein [Sphaerisporangium viridialbum]|uniref:PIN domain-containing protein n=1 Tax=Sphaerisporangium viridialbum TaxID=46189 RepID=UPI003C7851DC